MTLSSASRAISHSRVAPRLLIWSTHVAIFGLCGLAAFLLRFDFQLHQAYWTHLAFGIPIWIVVKSVVFRLLELDRAGWTQASLPDILRLGLANLIGSTASAALIFFLAPEGFPRSVYLIDLLLCAQATGGARILARAVRLVSLASRTGQAAKRIAIYGAGEAGVMLLRELRNNPRLQYEIVGFIDDDPRKRGMRIQLVPMLGCGDELPDLARRHRFSEVLIAIPSATGPGMAGILEHCHRAGVRCKTIPGLAEVIEGPGVVTQIRDVAVEDLLGRNPVRLEENAIRAKLEGAVVMVTGAAGSIGSELCRQIAHFGPRAIVAFEIAETALFHLEREMRAAFQAVRFHPEIGSVQNPQRLGEVFEQHRPSIVFHAAAYKHVPLMEAHLFEAVENNVFGTCNVALAAAAHGAGDFVMISSDKAVRPTNIMGLTKRVAEILVHSLQNGGPCKFVSVRFGNVLGSSGSVVPIFKEQIAAGGPVTVTHPEMRRFFMTIPEAAQLVLQASTMGKGGEVFVLDMGQPVKIVDLARNLILLSGLRPEEDIRIEFTGVRPGEKLYEELTAYNEDTLPTYHEKIKILGGNGAAPDILDRIETMRRLCAIRDQKSLLLELKELIPEYNPSMVLLRRLLLPARTAAVRADASMKPSSAALRSAN